MTSAANRKPRRWTVRMIACFSPLSPIARRAAWIRLFSAASDTARPFQTRSINSSLLTTRLAFCARWRSRSYLRLHVNDDTAVAHELPLVGVEQEFIELKQHLVRL